ncbi:C163A protein, partial [Chunga burmeisteri]|nr:C163A protein [Chunga burmeisteri]
ELRLVGGGGRCAGRVEVKHDGEWGSVCAYDFDWDALWATVVCRQLGCGPVAKASPYAPFGQGTGRIWLHVFFCRGDEAALQDCPHFGWGQHFCGHESDVGVTCAEAVELRLAAGGSPCAGRVEVKLRGQWGTVGDNNWDMEDAEVVCQQLGCGSAASAESAGIRFGQADGPISLALVDCRGDEAALWDCEVRGWGPYNAVHDFDTAVVCQGFARLVGGDDTCAGRLEVRRGKAWAGVCKDHVDIKAAQVVCRELGCGTALAVPGASRFEAGSGLLWEVAFECTGTESLLATCAQRPPRSQGCAGHASIICSCKRWGHWGCLGGSLPRHSPPNALSAAAYMGFRLADNSSSCAGRVEVEAGGTWRSLCAAGWDLRDAHILCHHLGCGPAVAVAPGGSFGSGHGPLRQDTFGCGGSERHPGECPVAVLGEPACPPGHAAAVNCSVSREGLGVLGPRAAAPARSSPCRAGSRRVRLAGGPGRCAGRVEVYVNGTWGTVCQESWDLPDATVVCRQLGCGTALAAPSSARFGPGTGPLWPGAGGCAGTEASLWDCPALAQHDCRRGGGAGAVCSGQLSLRLVGSSSRCSGHLEVLYNGTWGRVCANGTSPATAIAACRQLGCGAGGRLVAAPTQDVAPAWLAWVGCEEGARSLWRCPSAPW